MSRESRPGVSHFPRRVRARLGAAGLARGRLASSLAMRVAAASAPPSRPRGAPRPLRAPRPRVGASRGFHRAAGRHARDGSLPPPPPASAPRARPVHGRASRAVRVRPRVHSLGLANVLLRAGWRVSGTVRDAERAASLAARGVDAHVWRPDDGVALRPDALDALRDATHVLNSVPPVADFDRDPVLADPACVAALREKLEAVDAALAAAAPGKGNVVVRRRG